MTVTSVSCTLKRAVYKCNESLKTKTSLCRQAALQADKQPAPEAFIFHFLRNVALDLIINQPKTVSRCKDGNPATLVFQ